MSILKKFKTTSRKKKKNKKILLEKTKDASEKLQKREFLKKNLEKFE